MAESIFDKLAELKYPKKEKAPSKPVMPKQLRTIGDLGAIIETQRIYNAKIPPTNPTVAQNTEAPAPKAAPKDQIEKGTTPASDTEGNWGKPSISEK